MNMNNVCMKIKTVYNLKSVSMKREGSYSHSLSTIPVNPKMKAT